MTLRDRVVRVSLRSDADGVLEERGTIEREHCVPGSDIAFGYTVLWDALPPRFPKPRAQYVGPARVRGVEEWAMAKKGGAA